MISVGLMGCDRMAREGSAKLVIQTPPSSLSHEKLSASDHGISDPTSLADINCFGVIISGPTEDLRKNVCGQRDNVASRFPVGRFKMMIPAGQQIALDVPSGPDRVVRLIGLKAGPNACLDLTHPDSVTADFSRPYVLGTVHKVEMKAGATMEIAVPMSFDPTKVFDDCVGPDFMTGVFDPNRPRNEDGGGDSQPITPTQLTLYKHDFPDWRYKENYCTGIGVSASDGNGRQGTLDSPVSFQITVNGSPVPIYQSHMDCANDANESPSLAFPAGVPHLGLVIRTPSMSDASSIALSAVITTPSSGLTVAGLPAMPNGPSSGQTFRFEGPERILPDTCYPYNIMAVDINGGGVGASGSVAITGSPSAIGIYSDASCSSPATSFTLSGNQDAQTSFYVKVEAGATGQINAQMSGFEPALRQIAAGSGGSTISYIHVNTSDRMEANSCGWFGTVILYNSYSTAIPAPAGGIDINLTGVPSGGIHTDSACSTGSLISGTPKFRLEEGQASRVFHARFATVGSSSISFQRPNGATETRPLMVNGAYSVGLASSENTTAVAPGSCVEMFVNLRNPDGSPAAVTTTRTINFSGAPQVFNARLNNSCAGPLNSLTLSPSQPAQSIYVIVDNLNPSTSPQTIQASSSGLQNGDITFQVLSRAPMNSVHPSTEHKIALEYPFDLRKVIQKFTGIPTFSFSKTSGPGSLSGHTFIPSGPGDTDALSITDSAPTPVTMGFTTLAIGRYSDFDFTSGVSAGGSVNRSSPGTHYNSNGDLVQVTANTARIDHDPNPDNAVSSVHAPHGLLLEPHATNFVRQSSSFNNADWVRHQVNAITDLEQTTDPMNNLYSAGLAVAETLDGTTMPHVKTSISGSPQLHMRYTASIFVRKSDARFTGLQIKEEDFSNGTNIGHAGVVLDLDNGTVVGMNDDFAPASNLAFGRQKLKNGWYRVWVTYVSKGGTTLSLVVYPSYHGGTALSPDRSLQATGRNYFWGAQLEDSPMMTSHIITSGSSLSRQPDTLTVPLSSGFPPLSQTEPYGTLVVAQRVQELPLVLTPPRRTLFTLCDSSCSSAVLGVELETDGKLVSRINGSTPEFPAARKGISSDVQKTSIAFGNMAGSPKLHISRNGEGASSSGSWTPPGLASGYLKIGGSPHSQPTVVHLQRLEFWNGQLSRPASESVTQPPGAP